MTADAAVPTETDRSLGAEAARWSARHRLAEFASRWGTLIVLLILIVVGGVKSPDRFLTWNTFANVAVGASFGLVIALGLTLILIVGEFDLSIASTATLAGVTGVSLINRWGVPSGYAIVAGLLAAVAVGATNGFLVTRLRISSFIATLGISTVLTAVSYVLSDGRIQQVSPDSVYYKIGHMQPLSRLYLPAVVALVLAAAIASGLKRTVVGRQLYAVGGNRAASYLAGIRVRRIVVGTFITGSLIAGAGGILLSMNLAYGDINLANSYLLPAFAAAFIGASTVRLGVFHVWGTVTGAYLLQVVAVVVVVLGLPTQLSLAFQGLVLIVAVSLAALSRSTRTGSNVEI